MADTMTIDEAKAELAKITDAQIFSFRENGDITLFLICPDLKTSNEVNTIISFNRFEIDFSKNDYGEYMVLLVFIDHRFELPIATKWTNENYANFRLLGQGNGIYFVNTAVETSNGFNLPFTNKVQFVKHNRKKSL